MRPGLWPLFTLIELPEYCEDIELGCPESKCMIPDDNVVNPAVHLGVTSREQYTIIVDACDWLQVLS